MLNSTTSHRHHQDMIRQAQQQRLAREVKRGKANRKTVVAMPVILIAFIGLMMR